MNKYLTKFTDPGEKLLFKILKIFKRREKETMPIYYPNLRNLKNAGRKTQEPTLVRVEKNLFSGKYKNRNWKFIKDVNEAFEFIKSQFTKKSRAHQIANEVKQKFKILISNSKNMNFTVSANLLGSNGQSNEELRILLWYLLRPQAASNHVQRRV